MDIIIIALSRWDGKYSSTVLSLAKVFARTHRVFYIDNPFTFKEFFVGLKSRQVLRRIQALLFGRNIYTTPIPDTPNFIAVTPLLTLPINWLPKGRLYSFFAALNDRIVFKVIKKAIKKYEIQRFIYFNSFNPHYGNSFPADFKPDLSVYHCVDDISNSPYVAKHGTWLEESAISKYGMTITTSTELKKLKSRFSKNVHLLPNAANVQLFQTAAYKKLVKPWELKQFPEDKQFIVYMGNICHRLDYELLVKVADHFTDKVLLMVGPLSNGGYKQSGLNQRKNVIFTGQKSLEDLPAYLQYSHCAIIPFLCNALTKSIYPLKINEYLSAGKPVVTTAFSEDVLGFDSVTYLAQDHTDFIKSIDKGIKEDNEERKKRRIAFSASNSWEDRAVKFWALIDESVYEK